MTKTYNETLSSPGVKTRIIVSIVENAREHRVFKAKVYYPNAAQVQDLFRRLTAMDTGLEFEMQEHGGYDDYNNEIYHGATIRKKEA